MRVSAPSNTFWLAALSASCLVGCPKRIDFGPTGRETDAAALLARVRAGFDEVRSLRGEGKLSVDSPQGKGTLSLEVVVARPASLRAELTDFFGRPQALLVTDGKSFAWFDPQKNQLYRGPASPANVSRFLPVSFTARELVALMLGGVPLAPADDLSLALDAKEGLYRLGLGSAQTLWARPKDCRVVKSHTDAYDVTFDDFDPAPRRISVRAPSAALALRYKNPTLNGPTSPQDFSLAPPEGAEVVDVDESGARTGPAR